MEDVLYRIRNGKIVDPNIPMNGLVCYLDTGGKNNTDIYRNTLLDLSGNGNHGTLQSFSFTEESGYVKDSSGGLKFDGVDDVVSTNRLVPSASPHTVFIDFELEKTAMEQDISIYLSGRLYIHKANNLAYIERTNTYFSPTIGVGNHKLCLSTSGKDDGTAVLYLNGIKHTPAMPGSNLELSSIYNIKQEGVKKINKLMIWNRVLTEQEIQKLWGYK